MQIHCLIVLKKSGIPIYQKNYSDSLKDMDFNLFSSFLTAILQFSTQLVKKTLNILEIGEYRFFIRKCTKNFTFVLITDVTASVVLIQNRIDTMCKKFFNVVDANECAESNECIENEELDRILNEIVDLSDDSKQIEIEGIEKLFIDEIKNGEIDAAGLISMDGHVYFSTLPTEDLHTALKELEIRTQAQMHEHNDLPKLIFQSGDELFCSQIIESTRIGKPIYLILMFDSKKTTLGMADYALEDLVKKISELL
ncbi:MAG: hypothetical protein GF364_08165 [Candidatus Lokiarchaeota archaeon]|nr:hypothetical protein [Candidatus Lokiarchaeota archaeon]